MAIYLPFVGHVFSSGRLLFMEVLFTGAKGLIA